MGSGYRGPRASSTVYIKPLYTTSNENEPFEAFSKPDSLISSPAASGPTGQIHAFCYLTFRTTGPCGRKHRAHFGRTLRSESACFATRTDKRQEARFGRAFDCLQAVARCLQIIIAQPCCGSTFGRTARTKCAASRALSCGLIKKRASRLRFERGVGALLPYRVGQSGQGSP